VSIIAKPSVTLPPGELIYINIGLVLSYACKNKSCAIVDVAESLSISPDNIIILSFNNLENKS
jgi:hypothetical protein